MATTAKRTTATAAAIRPQGRRGAVTTCVGGRVRPRPPPPVRAADAPLPAADEPPRAGPSLPGLPGVRSLAKASPSNGCSVAPGAVRARVGRQSRFGTCLLPVSASEWSSTPAGAVLACDRPQYARAVTPEQLRDVVRAAVAAVVDRGALGVAVPDDVVIERPKNRSEEHTSELQSRQYLVCRLLLEKKNTTRLSSPPPTSSVVSCSFTPPSSTQPRATLTFPSPSLRCPGILYTLYNRSPDFLITSSS